jgi:hypothetical protein
VDSWVPDFYLWDVLFASSESVTKLVVPVGHCHDAIDLDGQGAHTLLLGKRSAPKLGYPQGIRGFLV